MQSDQVLHEITTFCRRTGLDESTFGRRAVNDGKLVQRLRAGGGLTIENPDRTRGFMTAAAEAAAATTPANEHPSSPATGIWPLPALAHRAQAQPDPGAEKDPQQNFRFFDNRQKYLLFVSTCSEKRVIAQRVGLELANIHPRPPAVRIFDAGVGDGTVLTRVMRSAHARFLHMPFYVVGKEISLEDIRLTLDKVPDRFFEHPATVLVLTNMYYAEAPWLTVKSPAAANSLVWREVALTGSSSAEFEK